MKLTKSIASVLAFLALGAVANANEANTIYITGSTAFRNAALTAIQNILSGAAATTTSGGTLAAPTGNLTNWINVTIPNVGSHYNIKCSFYGSVGGVNTTSNSLSWPFDTDATTGVTTHAVNWVSGAIQLQSTSGGSQITADTAVPDITFSDSFQHSTPFADNTLTDNIVGVAPFTWVASYGASAPSGQILSMSPDVVNALYSAGTVGLATLTGNPADKTSGAKLYAVGRDKDSGTRLCALAVSYFGPFTQETLQYLPTVVGTAVTACNTFYPSETINGVTYDAGDTGYASGGTLAGVMRNSTTAINGWLMTYLGKSDAKTALYSGSTGAGNAVAVAWNGIQYYAGSGTFNDAAVQQGAYTFWSYEHEMYLPTNTYATFGLALAKATVPVVSSAGVGEVYTTLSGVSGYTSQMQAARSDDGTYVTQNY